MMRCTFAQKRMSAYLDGELDTAAGERLAVHLETCERCRERCADLKRLQSLFARADRYSAPAGFSWRVAAAIRSADAARSPHFTVTMSQAARVFALTAVVVIGVASGSFLASVSAPVQAVNPAALLSLDIFAAAPPDSPGGVYLALTEADRE